MSGSRAFLDTNIFIYMYTSSEPQKKEACLSVLDASICVTSTQALHEICNVLTKKIQTPFADIRQILWDICRICEVRQPQRQTAFSALDLKERYGYSYYDCLMLASALDGHCDIFYSQDMSDGQLIENRLRIVDPFS